VDINLNTLKREIVEYLEASEFAVYRTAPGGLEGVPVVMWDAEQYPDYQMFLETARKAGARMVLFATRDFETADIDDALEQLEECEMTRDEQRQLSSRLRDMRVFEGVTCVIELAFDHEGRLYVYEVRPDWYDEFMTIEDEIATHLSEEDLGDDSLGGYFSRN
jgi:hypothetical protein